MMTATRDTLENLQWHWGSAYLITGAAGHWVAQRRDDGQTLVASGPEGLRELITEDYAARPVPAAHVQVAALRTTFPGYTFNLIRHRGEKPRIEALSRDCGSPYCLISDDAREIWRELHQD